jgi:hypothetical protein
MLACVLHTLLLSVVLQAYEILELYLEVRVYNGTVAQDGRQQTVVVVSYDCCGHAVCNQRHTFRGASSRGDRKSMIAGSPFLLLLAVQLLAVRSQLVAKTKEIPRDMVEAVSSIIYAAQVQKALCVCPDMTCPAGSSNVQGSCWSSTGRGVSALPDVIPS